MKDPWKLRILKPGESPEDFPFSVIIKPDTIYVKNIAGNEDIQVGDEVSFLGKAEVIQSVGGVMILNIQRLELGFPRQFEQGFKEASRKDKQKKK